MQVARGQAHFRRYHYVSEIEHQRDNILKYAKAKDDKYGIDVDDQLLKDYEQAINDLETELAKVPIPAKGEKQDAPPNLEKLARLRA